MTFVSPKTGAAGAARLPNSPQPRRPARAAAVLGNLGGGDLRPDGPLARPCRGLLLPATRRCRACSRPAASNSPTMWSRSTRRCATSISTLSYAIVPPQIDRSKPAHKQSDPTLYAGVVKERDDGIVISGAQQVATGGVLSDCDPPELHPSAAARRRELRQLRRRPGQRAGRQAHPAPAVRAACRQLLRLSAVEPVRRVRQLRRVRQRVRALGARVHLSQPGAHPRPVVQDAFAFLRQPSGAGALRHQAALHDRACAAHDRDDRQRRQPPVQIAMGELAALVSIYEGMLLAHETMRTDHRTACCGRR